MTGATFAADSAAAKLVAKKFDNKIMYPLAHQGDPAPDAATKPGMGGHVFGRLGYGDMNMPDKSAPFIFTGELTDNSRPGMMVSLFPYWPTASAIADEVAANQITLVAKEYALAANLFAAPSQPAAATAIVETTGAKFLAAGMIAVSAVAATLF